MKIRTVFVKLHLWVGLGAAILVVLVAGSGAILVFENEIERLAYPSWSYVTPQGQRLPLSQIGDAVQKAFPKLRPGTYFLYDDPSLAMMVITNNGLRVYVNQYTGQVLGSKPIPETITFAIHQFHTRMLIPNAKVISNGKGKPPTIIRNRIGGTIVGWTTVALLFLALTGLVVWFPRMIWTLNPQTGWRRLNFDLHNMSGIWALLLLVVLAGTGVAMSFDFPVEWIHKLAKTPESEDPPAVEFQRGVAFLSPDRMLDDAVKAMPGAVPSAIMMPHPPGWTTVVSFKFPEDKTPIGRSRVHIDSYTGEVLLAESSRAAPLGTRIVNYIRPVHTGDVFGWWTRIPMFLASLLIVLQAITGSLIWIARTFKKKGLPPSAQVPEETIEPAPVSTAP